MSAVARRQFSVWQFFSDTRYVRSNAFVSAEEASKAAGLYCQSVAAKVGVVKRVMITDGSDFCVFEWRFGEGVVWPRLP